MYLNRKRSHIHFIHQSLKRNLDDYLQELMKTEMHK
jgi:hypothetical protein